jgi:hypothetical protein
LEGGDEGGPIDQSIDHAVVFLPDAFLLVALVVEVVVVAVGLLILLLLLSDFCLH